jgi:PKD repeat protein
MYEYEKDILTFKFLAADNASAGISIDIIGTVGTNTVTLTVSSSVILTSLIPTITISDYATINPLSGVANDFSTPKTYTVTAEDGSTKNYTVTVKIVYNLPLVENFDGAAIPNGWTEVNTAGVTTPRWTISTTVLAGGTAMK